jgi:hypothetical protein
LKPFQRRILLFVGDELINQIIDSETNRFGSIDKVIPKVNGLDPTHCDIELMEIWNQMYDQYGYVMDHFQDR